MYFLHVNFCRNYDNPNPPPADFGTRNTRSGSPHTVGAEKHLPSNGLDAVPYSLYVNIKTEKESVQQKWKQQRDDFMKVSVELATEQAKTERLKKKIDEIKGKLALTEPQVKELGDQLQQRDSLMAFLTEKHQVTSQHYIYSKYPS